MKKLAVLVLVVSCSLGLGGQEITDWAGWWNKKADTEKQETMLVLSEAFFSARDISYNFGQTQVGLSLAVQGMGFSSTNPAPLYDGISAQQHYIELIDTLYALPKWRTKRLSEVLKFALAQ